MLSEALSFPRRGEHWLETLLIGGVLTLLGFLVIPVVFVNGYVLRVMRAAVEGEEEPPRFDDWADLFVDGLLVWVVEFVYVGVPAMVLGVVLASVFLVAAVTTSVGTAPRAAAGVGAVVAVVLVSAAVLFFVAVVYLLPAALANLARTGDFVAAFHLRTVARAALSVDYFVAVLLAIVVSIVVGFVGGLLVFVLVGFFVLFYLQVVVYHLFGQGFVAGLGLETAGVADPAD